MKNKINVKNVKLNIVIFVVIIKKNVMTVVRIDFLIKIQKNVKNVIKIVQVVFNLLIIVKIVQLLIIPLDKKL